jgi:NMD protein affecting ribosome stability and mRNA decay
MPKCTECGSYTKFEKGLCNDCYQEKKETKEETIAGMSEKEDKKYW